MREGQRETSADRVRRGDGSHGVSARPRRRWSAEEKAPVVRESFRPGKLVGEVAHRYGVSHWQLSAWRNLARAGKLAVPRLGQPEPVEVAPAAPESFAALEVEAAVSAGSIESVVIEAHGVTVRLQGEIGAERIAQVTSPPAQHRPSPRETPVSRRPPTASASHPRRRLESSNHRPVAFANASSQGRTHGGL